KTTALKIACEILILSAIIGMGGLLLTLIARVWKLQLGGGRLPAMVAGATALALTMTLAIAATREGLASRRPDIAWELETYAAAATDWNYPKECVGTDPAGSLRPCRLGLANDHGVLFIGDSFAMHIYGRFAEAAKLNPSLSFTFLASLGCPPVTGMRMINDPHHCSGFFEKALQFAEGRQFKRIILASRWYAYFTPKDGWMCFETSGGCRLEREPLTYFRRLDAVLGALRFRLLGLKSQGAEILLLGATPGGQWNVPSELSKRKFLGIATADIEFIDRIEFDRNAAPVKDRLAALASSIGGQFVDPLDFLCESDRCPTVDEEGVPYYIDDHHIRASTVKTARFQFLDDAAGISTRTSAAPVPQGKTSKY
ncbi:MAG: hypothetical protein L0Y57_02425, partial [Beijerinckiaceae bacterium]|nr:hypothetical protein [Beijerinckiaceae bacterium]